RARGERGGQRGHLAVEVGGGPVLAQVLERLGARVAGHVTQPPGIALLPVLEAVERELVEVVAGGVLRGREAVGVVLQVPGQVGEDLEQVLVGREGAGRVPRGRRARDREHEQERCDGCPHAAPIARAEKSCPPAVPPLKRAALGWLRGIVLVAMMAAAGRAAADDALARLHAWGTLRWGGDMQGGEPYVFQDPRDRRRLAGFEVEIADALARRLDVRAEFAQNDWQTLIPSLERGDFDVALNGIEVTPARRARVAFTRPYFACTETLVVRPDAVPVP